MSVKTPHDSFNAYSAKWKRCRDAVAGQDAVHAAREAYLPRLKDQDELDYQAYVTRSDWFNATWRTIAGLRGMLFRLPPKVEVPKSCEEHLDDIDMEGTPFNVFLQKVAENVLAVGREGLLVDYPMVENVAQLTLADAQAQNLRPKIVRYKAESILNWQKRRIGNKTVLSQVRLAEKQTIKVNEFTEKTKDVTRVLDLDDANLYRIRIYETLSDGTDIQISGDVYPLMRGKPLNYIPFYPIGVDDTSIDVDEPPLIDLVDMNFSHYRVTADYEHGCHFTGLPTPVVSGWVPPKPGEKLYIGSMTAWCFPDPNAKAAYLEFTGQGLDALKGNREHKEAQMAILGARMLEAVKRGVETAEVASIHRAGEYATLAGIADAISMGVEQALECFCEWAGADTVETAEGSVVFQLNKDFYPMPMDPQALAELVKAWQANAISKQTMFDKLKQGEIIPEDRTFEDEEALIEEQAPNMMPGQSMNMLAALLGPGAAKPPKPGDPKQPPDPSAPPVKGGPQK